jgi:CubicO group peptidase (beta-lactamase class C family)
MNLWRVAAIVLLSMPLSAATVPVAKPEDAGLSSQRLKRIAPLVEAHIAGGTLPGAVTLVARHGKVVHLEAHGQMDIEAKRQMQTSTIFRLASMTKPITAVAILMLMEENKLILGDPVSKFIPEFKNGKVAEWHVPNDPRGAGLRLVPVQRDMTLQDILTHTAGMVVSAEGPAGEFFERLKVAPNASLAERVKAWGALPLNFQPGT